jgi:hypothetical protein
MSIVHINNVHLILLNINDTYYIESILKHSFKHGDIRAAG